MSRHSKHHLQPWTQADVKRMRAIAKARPRGRRPFTSREAAALLGRSPGAVRYKAMKVGVHFRNVVRA